MAIHTSKRSLGPLLSILNVLNVSNVPLQSMVPSIFEPDAVVDSESTVLS